MSKKIKNEEGFDELIYEEILKARELETKPRMLLHACCAICASHVIDLLKDEFNIIVFYYNPNIHPKEEYEHRLSEVKRLIKEMGLSDRIEVIDGEYDTESYFEVCKQYKDEREGGARCQECFRLRLSKAAKYAKENNFDMFATTLTISPHKNSTVINSVGEEVGNEYGIHFAKSDFKKREGFKKSNELAAKYNIYRQNYCGCCYSMEYLNGEENKDVKD